MSPRRRTPPRAPEAPSDAPPEAPREPPLLHKYRQLLLKQDALVRKLEERTSEYVTTFKLSTWAMDMSASALALLRAGTVIVANTRWHRLVRAPGPWRWRPGGTAPGPAEVPATLRTLREVALHEATFALAGDAPRVSRYEGEEDRQVLELRLERVASPREALVLVLARDITAETRAEEELERARAGMAEREHLRALGEMVSGIAHDLNSTLNAMRLRLELLRKDTAVAAAPPTHLDAMMRILTDASTRVSRLQSFARQQPEDSNERVRLDELVRDAVDIARSDIEHRASREGLAVRVELAVPPLPVVKGQAADLRFVFINLLLNARDAMPRGGTIHVRGQHTGSRVILTVEDEGTGIPAEHLRDIFRPFFTTKGSQGTGLGLSMAWGVVSRAGGTLTAANRPEGGARFTLTFPVPAAGHGEPEPRKRRQPRQKPRTGRR